MIKIPIKLFKLIYFVTGADDSPPLRSTANSRSSQSSGLGSASGSSRLQTQSFGPKTVSSKATGFNLKRNNPSMMFPTQVCASLVVGLGNIPRDGRGLRLVRKDSHVSSCDRFTRRVYFTRSYFTRSYSYTRIAHGFFHLSIVFNETHLCLGMTGQE